MSKCSLCDKGDVRVSGEHISMEGTDHGNSPWKEDCGNDPVDMPILSGPNGNRSLMYYARVGMDHFGHDTDALEKQFRAASSNSTRNR